MNLVRYVQIKLNSLKQWITGKDPYLIVRPTPEGLEAAKEYWQKKNQ